MTDTGGRGGPEPPTSGLTLVGLRRMMEACPECGEPREWRGSSAAVRAVARLMATGQILGEVTEVYGFPVVVDENCPPGYLYFGRSRDFAPRTREDVERLLDSVGLPRHLARWVPEEE